MKGFMEMKQQALMVLFAIVVMASSQAGIFDDALPNVTTQGNLGFKIVTTIDGVPSTSGTAPVTFTFTVPTSLPETSILGTVFPAETFSNFRWDFNGDGKVDKVSSKGSVTWLFSESVSFSPVIVYATGSVSGEMKRTEYITVSANVNAPTNCVLTATPVTGDAPLTVLYTMTATSEKPITTYLWDLDGDGTLETTTTQSTVSKTYVSKKTISVFGKVKTEDKLTAVSNAVTITVKEPVSAGGDITMPPANATLAGDQVFLNATGTASTTGVSFEYRASGILTWTSIGSATKAGTTFYATWNVAGLAKGAYDLRATFTGDANVISTQSAALPVTLVSSEGTNPDFLFGTDPTTLQPTFLFPAPGDNPMPLSFTAGINGFIPAGVFQGTGGVRFTQLGASGLHLRAPRMRERIGTGLVGVELSADEGVEMNGAMELSFAIPTESSTPAKANLGVFQKTTSGTWQELTATLSDDGTTMVSVVTDLGTYVLAEAQDASLVNVYTGDGRTTYTFGETITLKFSVTLNEVVQIAYLGVIAPPEYPGVFATFSYNAPYMAVSELLPMITPNTQMTPVSDQKFYDLDTSGLWPGVYNVVIYVIRADGTEVSKYLPVTVNMP